MAERSYRVSGGSIKFQEVPDIFKGISWDREWDRTRVASRAMVQILQERGDLPQRISDARFSNIAEGIQQAMLAALQDDARRRGLTQVLGSEPLPEVP